MRSILTTASFRVADRFEAWASIQNELGMSVDPPAGATSYRASLSVSIFAALSKLTFNADSSPIRRLQATIRKVAWDQYWIYRENGRGAQFQFGDRAFNTLPGDIMVADADTPFHALATHSYHHDLWIIRARSWTVICRRCRVPSRSIFLHPRVCPRC